MRPVPERSHMLNTCPTKAGPPPLASLLSPATRRDLAVEGSESERVDSAEVEDSAGISGGV